MSDAPPWRVTVESPASRTIRGLSRPDSRRILEAIRALPTVGDVKRLQGRPGYWRLRVGGWRVIFRRDDQARAIIVERVATRGDIYKRR